MVLYMQSNLCPARFLEYLRCLFILSCAVGQHFRSPITASALNKPSSSFSSSSSPFTVRVCVYVCVRVCVCVCVCVCAAPVLRYGIRPRRASGHCCWGKISWFRLMN